MRIRIRKVAKSRKKRMCGVCYDWIQIGRPYDAMTAFIRGLIADEDLCPSCGEIVDSVAQRGLSGVDTLEELYALAEERRKIDADAAREDFLYDQWKERHYERKGQGQ